MPKISEDRYEQDEVEKVHDELKKHFRPEFLNRIDEIIVFHELTMEEVKLIVDSHVWYGSETSSKQGTRSGPHRRCQGAPGTKGYDPELGARPLRRSIQRLLEDPLSEQLLLGGYKSGTTVLVGLDEENDELTFEAFETPQQPPAEMVEQD